MNSLLKNTYETKLLKDLDFLNNIDVIIKTIQDKYKNKNTQATYINAITSILSRIPHFKNQYETISKINNDYSMQYQEEREKNDAPDEVIKKFISFDEDSINKLIDDINDINDKSLIAVYTLTPPRRLKDYYLMRITYNLNFDELDKKYNYIVMKNNKPFTFLFYNHKTKKTSEPQIKIPKELIKILNNYINYNKMVENDYLFGRKTTNFKNPYTQPKFTELLQRTFLKYTGKKISVDLIRTSKSTYLNFQNLSLENRRKIAEKMAHSLNTNMKYSKHEGLKRVNNNN